MKRFNKKGFTIVELVIVIAVIGILAGVLIPTFSSITQKANETAAMQEATAGRDAILVLTNGTMTENTMFYINKEYKTTYAFKYENGKMVAKNIESANDIKAPKFEGTDAAPIYSVYVSTDVLATNNGAITGFKTGTGAFQDYIASLTGLKIQAEGTTYTVVPGTYTTGDAYIALTLTKKVGDAAAEDVATIRVYWSADLSDTCVIFMAGTAANN